MHVGLVAGAWAPNYIIANILFLEYGPHPNLRTDNDTKTYNMWHSRNGSH
jgi:hypothetical protein